MSIRSSSKNLLVWLKLVSTPLEATKALDTLDFSTRPATSKRLVDDYEDITAKSSEATKFLFDQSKAVYDLSRERFKALDGKGMSITGLTITGLSAFAILDDPTKAMQSGGFLCVAFIVLFAALLYSLRSFAPRGIVSQRVVYDDA